MREGKWEKKQFKGSELSGKNLGLVGFGRIAQGVGLIAQSLGMNVHAYDPYLPPKIAKNQNTRLHRSVDTLFSNCTHISIHCNLTEETHHLVNYNRISKMPGKSTDGIQCGNHIVNCARGGIVNESDVLKALNDGILASAALDVFEEEPVPEGYELCQHPNFHSTPHIGASTIEAQRRVGLDIARNVMLILSNKKCDFIVNRIFEIINIPLPIIFNMSDMMENSRIIIHCDLDAFYAAVETLHHGFDDNIPLIIGSDPENGRGRGIVSTCNYAARKFGIRSAMAISEAGADAQGNHMVMQYTSEVAEACTHEHLVK